MDALSHRSLSKGRVGNEKNGNDVLGFTVSVSQDVGR